MFNILSNPLIRFDQTGGAHTKGSLPEVYAALMAYEVEAFPALRPHQRHAWHAFLVQLGAMAMCRAEVTEPPKDPGAWEEMIRGLTTEFPDDEPWQLVVDDITKPAFMQPPASSKDKAAEFKNTVATPDELDMLVTGKNHDVKSAVVQRAEPDEWILALITRQTMEGYSGAGNHGISRMNGGFGSRPAFSITPFAQPGGHARRDMKALLERRPLILNQYPMVDGGFGLLWTIAWDGGSAETLQITQLDPFYIEVCRRIRLRIGPSNRLCAVRTSSKAARVDSRALKGNTGDPWTPIDLKGAKSLTLAAGGFTYKRMVDYLFSADWEPSELQRPTAADRTLSPSMQLVARAMVRGQGKTEGYHERIIRLQPTVVTKAYGRTGGVDELGEIAQRRVRDVATIQRMLRHAVSVFAAGGQTEGVSDDHRNRANPWANKLDESVDATFFDDLQAEFEADDPDEQERIKNEWLRGVVEGARRILHDAEDSLPCPSIQRYRARTHAESVFEGRIRGAQGFPTLFQRQGVEA